eukprot:2380467-Pleurochrysis_carterae.AAC.1
MCSSQQKAKQQYHRRLTAHFDERTERRTRRTTHRNRANTAKRSERRLKHKRAYKQSEDSP